ncbi:hypothetical protein [Halodesulfovibrio aestuarii]|uniref:Uncharacterized protein n=1 Tax=Halodesulfovibrio aestuarii TaxID=126333 RepID=A0ABV4JTZ6_9BACT
MSILQEVKGHGIVVIMKPEEWDSQRAELKKLRAELEEARKELGEKARQVAWSIVDKYYDRQNYPSNWEDMDETQRGASVACDNLKEAINMYFVEKLMED